MPQHRVLMVEPCADCAALIPHLKASGWVVDCASLENAVHSASELCIFSLSEAHLANLRRVRSLVASSSCQWVAVVSAEAFGIPGVAELIAELFLDYHTLPLLPQRLIAALGRNYGMASLRRLKGASIAAIKDRFIGTTPQARDLHNLIRRVAPTDSPVLIRGESGTGKELIARSLHDLSARAKAPMVAINCGAIAPQLIQSELFGHEKGAFTGAHQRRTGRIEQAMGGTLFLDEIGDLPLEQQANLLRVLQERRIERVGSSHSLHVDFRVVAATHVDLELAVLDGRFREDLYYRLNVLEIKTSPLREQRPDIMPMAEHFANAFACESGNTRKRFSPQAIQVLQQHHWPGNVRELANRIQRGTILARSKEITPPDMGFDEPTVAAPLPVATLSEQIQYAERTILSEALLCCPHNMSLLAQEMGISRTTLYRLLSKHNLR